MFALQEKFYPFYIHKNFMKPFLVIVIKVITFVRWHSHKVNQVRDNLLSSCQQAAKNISEQFGIPCDK